MQKYGNNPQFRELMQEFSLLMGNHFEEIADKKKQEEEEKKKT
jgi:phage portal protein BeeE